MLATLKSALARPLYVLVLLGLPCAAALGADGASPSRANDVSLVTASGTLYGTELVPASAKPVPLVLMIAGSGPTDRDGNSKMLPGPNNSFKQLAEALAAKGIATLRYDKRAIGQSAAAATSEADLRFDTYVDDAAGWVVKLRQDKRFSRVVIAGHSEGSLVGMLAARQAGTDAYVSLAGPARAIDAVLAEQLKPQLPPPLFAQSERILAALKDGKTVADVPPELAMLYRASVQPYMISWLRYTPSKVLATLTMPILVVQGGADIQVAPAEGPALVSANPSARLVAIEDMNHLLKMVGKDAALQQKSYASPDLPVSEQLVDALSQFVLALH